MATHIEITLNDGYIVYARPGETVYRIPVHLDESSLEQEFEDGDPQYYFHDKGVWEFLDEINARGILTNEDVGRLEVEL